MGTQLEPAPTRTEFFTDGVNISGRWILWFQKLYDFNTSPTFSKLPTYADNALAIAAGLKAGNVYKTATGELRIVV